MPVHTEESAGSVSSPRSHSDNDEEDAGSGNRNNAFDKDSTAVIDSSGATPSSAGAGGTVSSAAAARVPIGQGRRPIGRR